MKELLRYVDAKEEGRREGLQDGIKEGENNFASLTQKLLETNRTDDLLRATTDLAFRKKLYEEFSILP